MKVEIAIAGRKWKFFVWSLKKEERWSSKRYWQCVWPCGNCLCAMRRKGRFESKDDKILVRRARPVKVAWAKGAVVPETSMEVRRFVMWGRIMNVPILRGSHPLKKWVTPGAVTSVMREKHDAYGLYKCTGLYETQYGCWTWYVDKVRATRTYFHVYSKNVDCSN